jgi:hypothetical protein
LSISKLSDTKDSRNPQLPVDIARDCLRRGIYPIPVEYKGKRPTVEQWPNLRLDERSVAKYFKSGAHNIGVLLGECSQWLIDVDLDCPETRMLAEAFLPATEMVFGRRSSCQSHWLYRAPGCDSRVFRDPSKVADDRTVLVEIRSNGHQTVIPGSTHPSGELIEWSRKGDPATVETTDLQQAVARLAAAALLARHWPSEGSRQETAMALAGAFLSSGWDTEEVEHFVKHVAEAAHDDEARLRLTTVRSTNKTVGEGKAVTGIPRLKELISAEVVRVAAEWLGLTWDACPPEIEHLNQKHAVVMEAGKTVVITETWDDLLNRHVLLRSSIRDFEHFYMNEKLKVGEYQNGQPRYEPLGRAWLGSKHRRQYEGIAFQPGGETPGKYNLWRGWAVEPREGDWSLLQAHLLENVCHGRQDLYEYNLN